ncbi:MAG: HEPN domain-containing protein [Deltaproteobacteria bacterium]|nr:HEPN domain-containing protein [Deltaproteobacteria bacterium]
MVLSDIKRAIVSGLRNLPIKVRSAAIYGSSARGTQTRDSDLDLLLISEDVNPRRHRRGNTIAMIKEKLALDIPLDILLLTPAECLSNFRNHNPLFLDITVEGQVLLDEDNFLKSLMEEASAYIDERHIRKSDDGWAFPVPERAPGFLSEVSNQDFAVAMVADGGRDFEIGVDILEKGYFDKSVYHFQQAAEKGVKAILICFGIFKKTHFVGELLLKELESRELEDNWKQRLMSTARVSLEIEPEVTWSRYPGIDGNSLWVPSEEYTKEDAVLIKDKCKEAVVAAREFVEWWFKK